MLKISKSGCGGRRMKLTRHCSRDLGGREGWWQLHSTLPIIYASHPQSQAEKVAFPNPIFLISEFLLDCGIRFPASKFLCEIAEKCNFLETKMFCVPGKGAGLDHMENSSTEE